MRRAFIICGPPSSGNRLVGSILVRAGCWGEGSTNQPKTVAEIPSDAKNIVWIHPPNLDQIIVDLKLKFEVIFVVVIREPEANCRSMVKSGFYKNLDISYKERIIQIQTSISVALFNNCKIEIITYEGLSNPMIKLWLTRLGLPVNNLDEPLHLVGQLAPDVISNENAKHY